MQPVAAGAMSPYHAGVFSLVVYTILVVLLFIAHKVSGSLARGKEKEP